MNTRKSNARGFTLIELMIVVVIVAVIAAVAMPSFFGQVRKSRRADAVNALSQVMQAQERYRADNTSYASRFVLNSNALTSVSAASAAASTWDITSGYYRITFVGSPSSTGYSVQAAARNGQTKDTSCSTMSVTIANGGNATYSPSTCFAR